MPLRVLGAWLLVAAASVAQAHAAGAEITSEPSDWSSAFDRVQLIVSRFWPLVIPFVLLHVFISRRNPGGWRRLAERYPAAPLRRPRRRFFAAGLVVGTRYYKNTAWLTVDDSHLHVSGLGPASLVLRRFSVPHSDIMATPDDFRWGPWNPRVTRMTFAREATTPVMVLPALYLKLVEASAGRLRLPAEAHPSPAASGSSRL